MINFRGASRMPSSKPSESVPILWSVEATHKPFLGCTLEVPFSVFIFFLQPILDLIQVGHKKIISKLLINEGVLGTLGVPWVFFPFQVSHRRNRDISGLSRPFNFTGLFVVIGREKFSRTNSNSQSNKRAKFKRYPKCALA